MPRIDFNGGVSLFANRKSRESLFALRFSPEALSLKLLASSKTRFSVCAAKTELVAEILAKS
jgi:hypothetical protein